MQTTNQSGTAGQFNSWIENASPDELTQIAQKTLARISQLPENQRSKFSSYVQSDTNVSKLFRTTV